jgi:hypothetical protein
VTEGNSAIPSPNIWHHEDTYEIENRGVDPDGVLWDAMRAVRSFDGADVLDIGCGSGFHLPHFALTASSRTNRWSRRRSHGFGGRASRTSWTCAEDPRNRFRCKPIRSM